MTDCLFCKIIGGQIPGQFVHQDDQLVAIKDINPQAPLHVLIIPRKHVATLNDLGSADDWADIIQTNLIGLMRVTHSLLPGMVSRNSGDIRSVIDSWAVIA